ncbi:guanine nucleotide-releasing factor 2 isoform X2 [Planococcus citri]|uniref:guanine nucleotide-releasing factor 2 isoform X2 n=1 Tax=Planococcus citri TaxID=170843 RepID=UPI0031F95FA4
MAAKKDNEKFSNDNGDTNTRTRISGSKLARRARSFKDDFFDKISSIRSPGSMSNGSRSNSPKSKNRHRSKSPKRLGSTADSYDYGLDNPLKDLECQMKQVQFALRYFQDVISKNKLEMLPGNGTIVLETIANIHSVLKSYALDEQSSLIVSGLNQVYQSVARLIKLCDDLLILGEKALDREYVTETIHSVEDAVQNLVTVVGDKISERENRSIQSESSTSSRCSTVSSDPSHYRVSLPEITMSPNERQLLEQTTHIVLERHLPSRILVQETSETPPPKPPLPNRTVGESPPPLPPKKRNANSNVTNTIPFVPATLSLERLSIKSDNSSVTSFDSSSGGGCLRTDLSAEDSAPVRMARERISSSSSSGFVSLRDSSHCFTEQQQQGCSFFTSTTSTVDGVVVTTSHNESHYATTSRVVSHFANFSTSDEVPPALPIKTRKFTPGLMHLQREGSLNNHMRAGVILSNGHNDSGSPPPLPLKKKHMFHSLAYSVMAYMEMFGNCSPGNTNEMFRRSIDSYNILQAEWQKHEMLLTSAHSCSFDVFCSSQSNNNSLNESSSPPPALPPRRSQLNSITSSQSPTSTLTPTSPVQLSHPQITFDDTPRSPVKTSPVNKEFIGAVYQDNIVEINVPDPLAETDVSQWLVYKRPDEDGPDIRGGHADALIVLATKANKNDFLYQEAFLTTYRTFITPVQLLEKLIDRYHRFDTPSDAVRQRAARETFSLLVRVVGDLTIMDLEEHVVAMLMEFVYQLLCSGGLIMGKALRIKLLEKYLAKLHYHSMKSLNGSLTSQNIYTRQSTLLDFKSEHIAEQMTLLDAELFTSIEIPEVLIWTQEQNEEKSPNLTRFTEHFNKMSYWARSRILEQNDAKDRERYVMKFIKIMKHLRKMNNFNSYLALLSALDSAPIRRLEWQKHITDGLKEYCALIDSSSSFRAYRQALAETQPPCIPYIGLVLQDLTFVHIGNNDFLNDGAINFSKRWQQFNIVENMKRFKKVSYNFKGHERIVAFFSNFDEFLCEEAMWQISESIKPRGGKKTNLK